MELAESHYRASEIIVQSLYSPLIKGLRQRPGVWLQESQMSSRFYNTIKTPRRGYLERSLWRHSRKEVKGLWKTPSKHSLVSFSCRSVVQFESLFAGDVTLKVIFLSLRLQLATIFNNAGVALAVLRHCVPANTCSGISRCDDWQAQTGPLCIHWGILRTKIQGHLTSVASPLQNTRPLNGKLKGTK